MFIRVNLIWSELDDSYFNIISDYNILYIEMKLL